MLSYGFWEHSNKPFNFRETGKQRPNFVENWREAQILGIITFLGANKPTYFRRTRKWIPPPHPCKGLSLVHTIVC